MNEETKDAALNYFNTVVSKSWTWARLTDEEKARFMNCIDFSRIHGTKRQRIEIFHMIYSAFLDGLGYKPIGWREPAPCF